MDSKSLHKRSKSVTDKIVEEEVKKSSCKSSQHHKLDVEKAMGQTDINMKPSLDTKSHGSLKQECDLLDVPAIEQLEKDEKYSLVYQLLKIFITLRLDAYLDFHAANSTLLKNFGLVHEDCITKMRLISLVDLSSNDSGEIPYSLIKETLQIEAEEVEYWVLKAITLKLLDCKMDQLNQIVIVSRHVERVFGISQWRALRSKLGVWKVRRSSDSGINLPSICLVKNLRRKVVAMGRVNRDAAYCEENYNIVLDGIYEENENLYNKDEKFRNIMNGT